jgi:hypothetical protein
MMRDAVLVPYKNEMFVIASDNSGGIGLKEHDIVKAPYHIVAYYAFRVAVMECMAAGAVPLSVIMHNFCGDENWSALTEGVKRGLKEMGLELPITGSSESNMNLLQSSLGLNVFGITSHFEVKQRQTDEKLAVIGLPLVGEDVLYKQEFVAPLSLFKWFSEFGEITLLPVGSKGILYELQNFLPQISNCAIHTTVDIHASSGPSTCFLISYPASLEAEIKAKAGFLFNAITFVPTSTEW